MGSMALEDAADPFPVDKQTTIQELINMYGEEAVRRGVVYIDNLAESEREYMNAAREGGYAEELADSISEGEVPEDKEEELDSKWKEGMESSGLGIDNE